MLQYHYAVRAPRHERLVDTAEDLRALYSRVIAATGDRAALTVMPDHFHVLTPQPDTDAIVGACRSYALWWNNRRGTNGQVFEAISDPRPSPPEKQRRDERYVHLNPVRAGLADDPLAWMFSLYRDAVDLSPWPLRRAVQDPVGYHRYVTRDTTSGLTETKLPSVLIAVPTLAEIERAVASAARVSLEAVRKRGRERRLFLQCARVLTSASQVEIARFAGVSCDTVARVEPIRDGAVAIIARIVGDPRFTPMPEGDLWATQPWLRYAATRRIRLPPR